MSTNYKFNNKSEHAFGLSSESGAGFTLIELIVVLVIFMVIIGVVVSIFLSIVKQQTALLSEQEYVNQTSYAIEYMSKALRFAVKDIDGSCLGTSGYVYVLDNSYCFNGAGQTCSGIKFINSLNNNTCEEFVLSSASGGQLQEIKNPGGLATIQNLLSTSFAISQLSFIINGDKALPTASNLDTVQPKVTILLNVLPPNQTGANRFKYNQTTVSNMNYKSQFQVGI